MASPFDPTRAVRFDLPNGSIHTSSDDRMLLVPAEALDEVVRSFGAEAGSAIGLVIGTACGKRASARLGGFVELGLSSLEDVIAHLGGEISLSGIGLLAMESWGRAMVMVVERAALRDDRVIAAVLEGALRAATGRDVACTPLCREGDTVRVLIASRGTAQRVRGWLADGAAWGDVLARLQPGGGAA